ncbi:MAG: hypothetical protein DCC73_13385 [Proteobacteria bacterium]|nr:MAG: hypothetical protein DCC73_13385 [Pseudomonadota bacterium]
MAKRDRKPIIRHERIELTPGEPDFRAKLKEFAAASGALPAIARMENCAKEYLKSRGLPTEYLNTRKLMPPGTPEGDAWMVLSRAAGIRDAIRQGNVDSATDWAVAITDAFWRMVIRAGIEDDALTGREVKAGASEAGRARSSTFAAEREQIIALADRGLSAGQIALKVGKKRGAVAKTIQRYKKRT